MRVHVAAVYRSDATMAKGKWQHLKRFHEDKSNENIIHECGLAAVDLDLCTGLQEILCAKLILSSTSDAVYDPINLTI